MKRLKTIAIISASMGLFACSEPPVRQHIPDEPLMIKASSDLIKIAKDIRASNKQLNILIQQKESASNSQKANDLIRTGRAIPPTLQKKLTLSWNGDSEIIVDTIAKTIGYKTIPSSGKKPIIPLIVSVSAVNSTAYSLLKDIGLQLGQSAILTINPEKKEMGISYINVKK